MFENLLTNYATELYWTARGEEPEATLKDSALEAAEAALWQAATKIDIVRALADKVLATAVEVPTPFQK